MKTFKNILLILSITPLLFTSCEGLLPDNKIDLDLTEEMASISYANLLKQGMAVYDYLPKGYDKISGAMMAAATDEADHAVVGNDIEMFQRGTWNAVSNPDNIWNNAYRGIRLSKQFLENSADYERIIVRDTSTASKLNIYKTQCADLKSLRAEARVMSAYLYFELLKRYGDVPIIDKVLSLDSPVDTPRSRYDHVVDVIISDIDAVLKTNDLQLNWKSYAAASFGRIERGAAMALKSRILLYWASPQNNPSNDETRWQKAAKAAKDVIDMNRYSLATNYGTMFIGAAGHQNTEVILTYMTGLSSNPESNNYPISTNGGASGTVPSANLVDAYENLDGSEFDWALLAPGADPYAGRDPRLMSSIVVNKSTWNGRIMQCYNGGAEGNGVAQASTTGYYLKKFLTDNLNLELKQTAVHSWPLIRYTEILLNYAEAMNEAYGPDADYFGGEKSARWAINAVRGRVGMPPVVASDQPEMRKRIKHERRIELAFEDHRFWDLRRWGVQDAKEALASELHGVSITMNDDGGCAYESKVVEKRTFVDKMMLYPIPKTEILQSNNVLQQNPGW